LGYDQRSLTVEFRQRMAKPNIGFLGVSECFFGNGLDSQQTYGAIRFVDGEGLLFLGSVTARTLRNDEPFDFLVAKPSPGQPLKCGQRKSVPDRQSKVGLRSHNVSKDPPASELSSYNFSYRHRCLLNHPAICRINIGNLPKMQEAAKNTSELLSVPKSA
jgi:hypothetical protein